MSARRTFMSTASWHEPFLHNPQECSFLTSTAERVKHTDCQHCQTALANTQWIPPSCQTPHGHTHVLQLPPCSVCLWCFHHQQRWSYLTSPSVSHRPSLTPLLQCSASFPTGVCKLSPDKLAFIENPAVMSSPLGPTLTLPLIRTSCISRVFSLFSMSHTALYYNLLTTAAINCFR